MENSRKDSGSDAIDEPSANAQRAGRPPWSEFRAALEDANFRPSRRLGQNFLLDENMVRAIVRDAQVKAGDRVLEVGAGCGFLTLHLARAGVRLTSVEIDERLLAIARRLLAREPNVEWIAGDVLAGKHAIDPQVESALPEDEPWHLVSNLPYSVAAPLLAVLAERENPPASITVLVQREVALRIAAKAGTPDWGPLSIRLQLVYAPRIVRQVPAALFWPRPDVESAVVRLELLPEKPDPVERAELDRLVSELFQRRRQALARVLTEISASREHALALLADVGIDPRERAENLDLETFRRLARARLARGEVE